MVVPKKNDFAFFGIARMLLLSFTEKELRLPVSESWKIRQFVLKLVHTHTNPDVPIQSERELCRMFGVSRPTVRHAVRQLVEEGLLAVRQGQGVFINPASITSRLPQQDTFLKIGFLTGSGRMFGFDGFFMGVMEKVLCQLKTLPVNFRFLNLQSNNITEVIEEFHAYEIDGLLWLRPTVNCMELVTSLRKHMPVYQIGNVCCKDKYHVTMDYARAGALAAEWFLNRKCKSPVFVGAPASSGVKDIVFKGWKQAFKKSAVAWKTDLVIQEHASIADRIRELACDGNIDGIFSFGSEYVLVDQGLSLAKIPSGHYPILIDENNFGDHGVRIKPSAKIDLKMEESAALAAQLLYNELTSSKHPSKETILHPAILL